ncbi:hypothetical protein SO802_020124 [Lithocarpus litseifolius]|uniref:Gag protein n=1 Tax=Lithocarpus litseifolius TaxID=425828 RepID=A0AAW2CBM8_9ROSI
MMRIKTPTRRRHPVRDDDVYLRKIKVVRDKLLAVEVFLDDKELLHIAIKGLPKECNTFRSTIRTRSTQISFDELATMLNAEEESLNEGLEIKDPTFAMVSYNRGRGRNNNSIKGGRGGKSPSQSNQFAQSQGSGSRPERPTCQIYRKLGHFAINCYHCMDYAYQGKHPPTKLAALATTSNACIT